MSSYRTFVIANPESGNGSVRRDWSRVERLLRARIGELEIAFTEGPGHATMLAREALRAGWEMVVAVGGDGTVNEVVNGFYERPNFRTEFELDDGWIRRKADWKPEPINPDAVFGFIPMGTGGDFRRTVGAMGSVDETVKLLGGIDTRPIDLGLSVFLGPDGHLDGRFFINISSAGMGGMVDRYVNKMWKGMGGKLSFTAASAMMWLKYENAALDVRIDDLEEIHDKFFNVVVANGEYFGGGMWVAPGARIDDGKFQVVLFGDLSKGNSASLIGLLHKAEHLDLPQVSRRNAASVSIRAAQTDPVYLDIDGEAPGRVPVLFTNLHQILKMKVGN
jgi:diacylglycerol kinase (ATP)